MGFVVGILVVAGSWAGRMAEEFLASGGRAIACAHCVGAAGMSPGDMLPGVEIDSRPEMPKVQRLIDREAQSRTADFFPDPP